jgi:hypothetical protein
MSIAKGAPGFRAAIQKLHRRAALSLDELAHYLDPETYQELQGAIRARAEAFMKGDAGLGTSSSRGATVELYRLEPTGAQKAQSRINDALAKLSDSIRHVIASPAYRTEGFGPAGTVLDVPRAAAHQLIVDIESGSLATAAGWVWEKVTVIRSGAAAKSQAESQPKRADRKELQRLTRQLIEEIYDGKLPPSYITTPAVRRRLSAEKNHTVGDDTVRRARGLKR